MDPELQKRIQAARDAGYSDEEIQAQLGGNVSIVPSKVESIPNVPVLTAEERARLQQEEAVETTRRENVTSPEQTTTGVSALGMGAAGALGTGALLLLGKRMLSPAARAGTDLATRSVAAAEEANRVAAQSAQQLHERELMRQEARQAAQQVAQRQAARPVVPSSIINPATGQPFAPSAGPVTPQPVAPQAVAQPAPSQASMLDRTTNMIRQMAANKVVQNLAKGGAAVTAALMPGNVGQEYMVPQVGRMRGMEINPMTGRPWTREQLQAYNANPAAFDSALGAAQMPR